MEYNAKSTHSTVFGKMEITYVAAGKSQSAIDVINETVEFKESHYVAVILDGGFNGWNAQGTNRENAAANLMQEVAKRYGYMIVGN